MMKKKIFILVLIGVFFYTTCSKGSKTENIESNRSKVANISGDATKNDVFIDEFAKELHQKYHFNGNILVAQKGKILYEKSFGWANYLLRDSLQIADKFQLASITKTFTAVATLQLVEKGKLSLDDTIEGFFPSFPSKGITIRMLLSHRSGLANYVYFTDKHWKNKEKPMRNIDVINLFIKHKTAAYSKPNAVFFYNNTNFMLLAAIIEKVSNLSFNEYLKKNIFEKADMKNTLQFSLADENNPKFNVIGYDRGDFRYSVVPNFLDGVVGDKGMYSTAQDLYKYHIALSQEKILGKQWQDSAYLGRNNPQRMHFNYGYGWRIFDGNNHKVAYHTGWWHGFRNILVRDLKTNTVIIFLGNLSNGSLQHLDKLYTYLGVPVIRRGAYDANGTYRPDSNHVQEE